MSTDLVLCKEYFSDLGFDKVVNVNPVRFDTKKDLKKKLDKELGLRIVWGGKSNRIVVEMKKIDLLLSPEKGVVKDSLHHRNSGLNHVVCKLAQNNDIAIGFNLNDVLTSKGVKRADIIGRMLQNVKLCRSYKLRMVLGSFARDKWQMRSKNDLISFGVVLGMHPEEARKSLQAINVLLEEKEEKKHLIIEGIKVILK